MGIANTTNNAVAKSGVNALGKVQIVTVGVGGGAISQAQLDGILAGLQAGRSLDTDAEQTDAFTILGVANTFTAASSTSAVVMIAGTGTPSTATGDYFASATLAITNTFASQ
jgi:hypothetical protein